MRHQTQLRAKENTQGRHYTRKSGLRTVQPLDLTRLRNPKIVKITLELRKLG
jgi:hypothetical protein